MLDVDECPRRGVDRLAACYLSEKNNLAISTPSEAFGQPQEAALIDALRSNCDDLLSLVAVNGEDVVGHILFSPATLGSVRGMGLAPMAVTPECQKGGVGSQLIRVGLATLAERGCPFVIVLGHAEYYPRFGFEPASARGVRCEWDVPDEVFMLLVLDEPRMDGVSGLARYRQEFSALA